MRLRSVEGLVPLLVRETGKTTAEAASEPWFAEFLTNVYRDTAAELDAGERLPDENGWTRVYRVPYGVVAAITPANYPLLLSLLKVLPALLTGNVVVLAVPPTAPLGTLTALEAMAHALPDDVLQVVTGEGAVVANRLVTHPRVRALSFTGSVPTGKLVSANAAATLKHVNVELGGNDPAIVLPDADFGDKLFAALTRDAFMAAGQVCFGIKRVYVPQDRVDETVEGLLAQLDSYIVGNGLDEKTTMGPVHTGQQRDRLRTWVEEARSLGATVRSTGTYSTDPEYGWFVLPTIVSGVDHRARLVVEEQFGPILPVVGYRDVNEAVRLANDVEFGLGSSIWSPDEARAVALGRRIEAGATWINGHGLFAMDPRPGLGGFKASGNGGEGGRASIEGFTQSKVVSAKY